MKTTVPTPPEGMTLPGGYLHPTCISRGSGRVNMTMPQRQLGLLLQRELWVKLARHVISRGSVVRSSLFNNPPGKKETTTTTTTSCAAPSVKQSGKTRRSSTFVWWVLVRFRSFGCMSASLHSESTPDSTGVLCVRLPCVSYGAGRTLRTVTAVLTVVTSW